MRVLKFDGKVYGGELTSAEKKALGIEIRKEAAEHDRKFAMELEATVLWELQTRFGFDLKQLKEFHDHYGPDIEALIQHYELEKEDDIWLCTKMLKNSGVDLEQWEKEGKQ